MTSTPRMTNTPPSSTKRSITGTRPPIPGIPSPAPSSSPSPTGVWATSTSPSPSSGWTAKAVSGKNSSPSWKRPRTTPTPPTSSTWPSVWIWSGERITMRSPGTASARPTPSPSAIRTTRSPSSTRMETRFRRYRLSAWRTALRSTTSTTCPNTTAAVR